MKEIKFSLFDLITIDIWAYWKWILDKPKKKILIVSTFVNHFISKKRLILFLFKVDHFFVTFCFSKIRDQRDETIINKLLIMNRWNIQMDKFDLNKIFEKETNSSASTLRNQIPFSKTIKISDAENQISFSLWGQIFPIFFHCYEDKWIIYL